LRVKLRDVVRESDLSAAEQSELLFAFVSFSYRPLIHNTGAERCELMADDSGPFAACVAAPFSPTVPDAMICPPPDSVVPSNDTDVDFISCGPFAPSAVVLEEAPVPNQLERSDISPRVDLRLTVDGGALASGVFGPPVGVVASSEPWHACRAADCQGQRRSVVIRCAIQRSRH
jgi:hypothetical protein